MLTQVDEPVVYRVKQYMDELLKPLDTSSWRFGEQDPWQYAKRIPIDDPRVVKRLVREKGYIFAAGTLVLELGNFGAEDNRIDLVGKVCGTTEDESISAGYYNLWGGAVADAYPPDYLQATVVALREIGFQNVPFYQQFKTDYQVGPEYFHISADLRENGRYNIFDIDEFPFNSAPNSKALKHELKTTLSRIKAAVSSGKYHFSVSAHGTISNPDEALEHMLFGRVDRQTGLGDLVFGDLEHAVLFVDESLAHYDPFKRRKKTRPV